MQGTCPLPSPRIKKKMPEFQASSLPRAEQAKSESLTVEDMTMVTRARLVAPCPVPDTQALSSRARVASEHNSRVKVLRVKARQKKEAG